ncbi:retrotransposon protein, putative, ty1-copia subclass [Tanacetum coccineum]
MDGQISYEEFEEVMKLGTDWGRASLDSRMPSSQAVVIGGAGNSRNGWNIDHDNGQEGLMKKGACYADANHIAVSWNGLTSILQQEKLTGLNFTNWFQNLRIVLRSEGKLVHLEQPLAPRPDPTASQAAHDAYDASFDAQNEMKSYLDTLERLGYAMSKELGVSLILNSLNKDYDQFIQNYNMHSMGKTLAELHAMLKFHEKGILRKAETPTMLAIREGWIQKDKKKKPQGEKGKGKGKNNLAYNPKPKNPVPPKREHPEKDSICHHCKENSMLFLIRLGCMIRVVELICNTSQGLRERRKLKHEALSLYMGNGMRAAVKAIRSLDLIRPSGLIIVLDNCHFAPTVTRGVVSISHLVNNGFIHTFTNFGMSVSKDNVFYFNAIPRDGIYEIDMHNLYLNKHMDMLQRDGLLQPTHDESHEKCKSCIFGKMVRKPFPYQVEKAKDLLGLIHADVCGPFRVVSREGASYFITFTDDFSCYGFVYLMKHKHEVFEIFKVFQNEVENQLGKKIKAIQSDPQLLTQEENTLSL